METMRATWTDDRLDDLSKKVDDLAQRTDAGFARVESRIDKLDGRIDAMQRTMIQSSAAMTATIVAALVATRF
jgi:tetrahydromethanopterin S-methyltransferase subunit G